MAVRPSLSVLRWCALADGRSHARRPCVAGGADDARADFARRRLAVDAFLHRRSLLAPHDSFREALERLASSHSRNEVLPRGELRSSSLSCPRRPRARSSARLPSPHRVAHARRARRAVEAVGRAGGRACRRRRSVRMRSRGSLRRRGALRLGQAVHSLCCHAVRFALGFPRPALAREDRGER